MKDRVQVRGQVKDFLDTLAPEPRRRLKRALRELEGEDGNRLPLRERLAGYHRLRVGGFRVIYRNLPGRIIECVFAEERSLVYQLFEREVIERLRREEGSTAGEFRTEEAPAGYGTKPLRRRRGPKGRKPSR